jgi:hypothetical protein
MHPANVLLVCFVQVWDILRPSGRRQAPSLWWTAPPPPSAEHVSVQTALAASQTAAPVSGTQAHSSKKADQRRIKPTKPGAAPSTPVMPAADPPKAPALKRSCAGWPGSAAMTVADLDGWLAEAPPEEAEEARAGGQAPVQRPKRKAKPVEVGFAQSRDSHSCKVGRTLLVFGCGPHVWPASWPVVPATAQHKTHAVHLYRSCHESVFTRRLFCLAGWRRRCRRARGSAAAAGGAVGAHKESAA